MNVHENEDEDDDLPVLTDVLRVRASTPREALDPRRSPPDQAPSDQAAEEAGSGAGQSRDEEIVIGTAPDAESNQPPAAAERIATAAHVEAAKEAQPHSQPEHLAGETHPEPFDEEDEVFLESFDGVATPEDLDAIEHLGQDEALAAAPDATPAPFDSDAMAARVRDAVLEDLAQRIDTELDARLAQSVTAQLESALAGLQSSLRVSLAEALRDVVRRAVDDEIARIRDSRGA